MKTLGTSGGITIECNLILELMFFAKRTCIGVYSLDCRIVLLVFSIRALLIFGHHSWIGWPGCEVVYGASVCHCCWCAGETLAVDVHLRCLWP